MLRGALSEASGRPPGFLDLARMRAPGSFRTCDTRFRRAVLYPLSYEGRPGRVAGRGVDLLTSGAQEATAAASRLRLSSICSSETSGKLIFLSSSWSVTLLQS